MLHGSGREVGVALVKHPLVKAVGFTGSRGGGRALMDVAAARPEPIPIYAEMGSVNPVFILPGALAQRAEQIATGLHASVTLGGGQFCTNPGVAFVEAGKAEPRLKKFESLIGATPAAAMPTPSILSEFHAGVEKFSKTPGVRQTVQAAAGKLQAGATFFQTDAAIFLGNHELMNEIFGPSVMVISITLGFPGLVLAEAILSYLQLGVAADTAHGAT
jgi:alpha-ketoglutaric semialdehyde dehydrogenase